MKYSDIALKVLAAKECGLIKTNAQFWGNYSDQKKFNEAILNNESIIEKAEKLSNIFDSRDSKAGMICAYDNCFPFINRRVKNNSEKPYLLFYKGDLSLLNDLNRNVAVIGHKNPDVEIIKREKDIVRSLTNKGLVIVSGLATGCDSIAHETCLETNGKTIAILPSPLGKVFPADNIDLADEIINKGGLLVSEYYKEATYKHEFISRFVERDRLQAMFSKAVILIASYSKGEGDSGSRHAMEAARKYKIERYIMYNSDLDKDDNQFGLNRALLNTENVATAKVLLPSLIDQIDLLVNPDLDPATDLFFGEQLTLL